jgi:phosphatidate cytidylyltransferase
MNRELTNRILTALVLLFILTYSLYFSGYYFLTFLSFIYVLSSYEILKNTKNLLFNVIANIILIFALFSFYYLRGDSSTSLVIISWILVSTFLSDTGGYIFGRIFKGKKLTKISPNKTYSGSFGSIIFSCTSIFFLNFSQEFFLNKILINFLQVKYLLLCIMISIICQLGDLYVSFWKRKKKIKDISNILPGHGGVLDRIDGLIFVLIFSFLIKQLGFL